MNELSQYILKKEQMKNRLIIEIIKLQHTFRELEEKTEEMKATGEFNISYLQDMLDSYKIAQKEIEILLKEAEK